MEIYQESLPSKEEERDEIIATVTFAANNKRKKAWVRAIRHTRSELEEMFPNCEVTEPDLDGDYKVTWG